MKISEKNKVERKENRPATNIKPPMQWHFIMVNSKVPLYGHKDRDNNTIIVILYTFHRY